VERVECELVWHESGKRMRAYGWDEIGLKLNHGEVRVVVQYIFHFKSTG
jgi:hypothetical protein